MKLTRLLPVLCLLISLGAAGAAPKRLVICAPGYPGTTAQAQPSMDSFARAAERAAGWAEGDLGAVYHEAEAAGLERLGDAEAALALVPLPFLLEHGEKLGLHPRLRVVQEAGADEVWSLVAPRGQVTSPASLEGWEVTGTPAYAPGFVRGPALGGWGELPATARITFTPRPLSALRRAAAGEKVAVILDRAQTEALASLPFAEDLEIVTRSGPLPGALLCTVAGRIDEARAGALIEGLLRLHEKEGGAEILRSLRMTRFDEVDPEALKSAREAFDRR